MEEVSRRFSGGLLGSCYVAGNVQHGIVGEHAAAAFAEHDLIAAPQILEKLRPESDLTGVASAIRRIGDYGALGLFPDPLVFGVDLRVHLVGDRFALCTPIRKFFLIGSRTFAGAR